MMLNWELRQPKWKMRNGKWKMTNHVLVSNNPASTPCHYFFPLLIGAPPFSYDAQEASALFSRRQRNNTFNCVAGKDRTMKSESHLTRDQIEISADLGGQSCS